MLLTEPAPVAIWAILMLLTLPALIVLASPYGVRDPRRALIDSVAVLRLREERREAERARRSEEAAQTVRYAGEIRVAADQAGYAAERWQGHWEAAAERVDTTWRAWQAADARWARSQAAAAFGTPFTARNPAEYAARERFLHQAVRAAAERGELPAGAVADALNGRGGWDARLHPVQQELAVQRAVAAHLASLHRRAVAAEQAAWHDAQLARRNRDSLRREAVVAEARAAAVEYLVLPVPATEGEAALRRALAPVA
ncbi:hypothetical protein [Actinoplanes aureus]|uniref:Uncharacterized protein n=1 Tax=Actinoplanes aureus TaxID=2792083 RepID=A0A931CDP8_9ACTN|nr:hypothetical protein [Actinoplanes aureus]MBG0563005.1 hypothetical protein [Actinoplanes aureus]